MLRSSPGHVPARAAVSAGPQALEPRAHLSARSEWHAYLFTIAVRPAPVQGMQWPEATGSDALLKAACARRDRLHRETVALVRRSAAPATRPTVRSRSSGCRPAAAPQRSQTTAHAPYRRPHAT